MKRAGHGGAHRPDHRGRPDPGEQGPAGERGWLEAHGIRPRKRLGQNFLIDPRIPEETVRRASWAEGVPVVEIGAGGGALTAELLTAGHPVTALELDPLLASLLEERFAAEVEAGRLVIVRGDALLAPFPTGPDPAVRAGERPAAAQDVAAVATRPWLAGNLPYGVTTPLLLKALAARERFAGAVFMVQREYADRLTARAGEEAYSSISVWTAAHAIPALLLRVGRSSFWPRPGVESSVIQLLFPDPPPYTGDRRRLERVLRAAFGQRRKTLENALAHGLHLPKPVVADALRRIGIDPGARGETLGLDAFGRIAEALGEPVRAQAPDDAALPEQARSPEAARHPEEGGSSDEPAFPGGARFADESSLDDETGPLEGPFGRGTE